MTSSIPTRDESINLITNRHTSSTMSYATLLENDLKILQRQYEEQVEKINAHYATYQLNADKLFNLSLKKINALYDSYEITLGQIQAYTCASKHTYTRAIIELLKENINNIKKNIIDTAVYKEVTSVERDITIKPDINTKSIKLAFDPNKLEYPLFTNDDLSLAKGLIHWVLSLDHRYYINIVSSNYTTRIYLNDILCDYIKCCIIDELDIIILWESLDWRGYPCSSSYVFIRISTGELIDNFYNFTVYSKLTFTYCNSTIICIDSECTYFTIRPFYIDKFRVSRGDEYHYVCKIEYPLDTLNTSDISDPLNPEIPEIYKNPKFFGDSRGLYIFYQNEIYFINKLQMLLNPNDEDRDTYCYHATLSQKIKLDIGEYELINILNIDYDRYTLYVVKKPLSEPTYTSNSNKELTNVQTMVYLSIDDRRLVSQINTI